MKSSLVGYTGFVGSNLALANSFTHMYNSKNISDAFNTKPELLVYAGISAEKFWANSHEAEDFGFVQNALENIRKIDAKQLVLISTIDVYPHPCLVNENTSVLCESLEPYGKNRCWLEQQIRLFYPDALIVRLPGLFGENIKKNFIYDFINVIPSKLTSSKMNELLAYAPELSSYYKKDNDYFVCTENNPTVRKQLKEKFSSIGFTALNFTDSRGEFQFYNLAHLWDHICTALRNQITLLNIATEPIKISELHFYLRGKEFFNHLPKEFPTYNFTTIYDSIFGGDRGYIYSKEFVLKEIAKFIEEQAYEDVDF